MNYTTVFRTQACELESLMQMTNVNVREAAGMLGFLDLGMGLTNMGVVLQLSRDILDLVLKIQASGADATAQA